MKLGYPCAHRSNIFHPFKGLEDVIPSIILLRFEIGDKGLAFNDEGSTVKDYREGQSNTEVIVIYLSLNSVLSFEFSFQIFKFLHLDS
jgi:glutathionyl-hydroquinone reductase